MGNIYSYQVKSGTGDDVSLEDYKGQVLLVVNTASKCGFTPQYTGLEEVFKDYKDRGFSVLAFPCNQFGGQEPGSNEQIAEFCDLNFSTSFPLFAKVDVNGKNADPLFDYLKREAPGIAGTKAIKWNFTKFLVDRSGNVVKRYGSRDTPKSIRKDIEALL